MNLFSGKDAMQIAMGCCTIAVITFTVLYVIIFGIVYGITGGTEGMWNETTSLNDTVLLTPVLLTGRFIVAGSDGMDGVYIASMSDAYYQSGENYLVKRQLEEWEGWVLASGPSLETAQVIYRSNNSDEEVPNENEEVIRSAKIYKESEQAHENFLSTATL